MSIANQQTLAELGAESRPPILDKGSYVSWASRFLRFLDNRREEGYLMRHYTDKDACKDAQTMWNRIKILMQGTYISRQERNLRLMNDFDKFVAEDGESLTFVYESKYVTLARQKYVLEKEHFDVLYDYMSQFEPHIKASKVKKAARNHDPLALVANSHAHSSYYHASSSYSSSVQPYYVTHPSSVIDNDHDYQGDIQGDSQEDKLSTAMMLLAQAITQHYSASTNNRLRTSSNTRNQAVIQDGCVDIQNNIIGYAGNGNKNVGRTNRNQATNAGNGLVQNIEEYDQNVQRVQRTESTPGKTNV
ncbi:hypothetical protein Tco_1352460 [Tanacetum coccineum]